MPHWDAAEVKTLKRMYAMSSNLVIARELQRSIKSVVSKAHHLHLRKTPQRLREMGRENVRVRYREKG